MVECELKELGCEGLVQRKDTDKHMEQAAQKHLRLSISYFIKNQRRQDEKIANLQERNLLIIIAGEFIYMLFLNRQATYTCINIFEATCNIYTMHNHAHYTLWRLQNFNSPPASTNFTEYSTCTHSMEFILHTII